MKYAVIAVVGLAMACSSPSEESTQTLAQADVQQSGNAMTDQVLGDFYSFSVNTLEGEIFNFENLRGKRVLFVNTASRCGYTGQYEQLQELYDQYGGEEFTIIGFPSNDFGRQEPGSNTEIREFCTRNYGVSFPMMEKISVRGNDIHPVYQWLTQSELNGVSNGEVKWNFHKFLVDENGTWVKELTSGVSPLDEVITNFAEGN